MEVKRRRFLEYSGAIALGPIPALARDPIARSGPARFRFGLAAYSLRDYFAFMKGKPKTPSTDGAAIDMIGFLDYCVAQNLDSAELTSYFFPTDFDDDYLLDLRREAFVRGLSISGTAIGNNFTVGAGEKLEAEVAQAIQWIDRAAVLGAPHIRVFAGTGAQLADDPRRMDEACDALNRCAKHAAEKGIFLGVENHGNLTSDQMLEIMARMDNPWVGINLDSGNFVSDDPYEDLRRCIPFAVNVQIKVSMRRPDKTTYPADLARIGKLLRDGGYQGFVILEYEEERPYDHIPQAVKDLKAALDA